MTEQETVGRVLTSATIENMRDLWDAECGRCAPDQVRRLELTDALVDTGAIALSLPTRYIRQLGLTPYKMRQTLTAGGPREAMTYEAVRLTIQDRTCTVDVLEVPDAVPALVGQIPLEFLDFVVDLQGRRLIGNPAHGGEQMLEMY